MVLPIWTFDNKNCEHNKWHKNMQLIPPRPDPADPDQIHKLLVKAVLSPNPADDKIAMPRVRRLKCRLYLYFELGSDYSHFRTSNHVTAIL